MSEGKRIRDIRTRFSLSMEQLKPPSMCWTGNLSAAWNEFMQRFRLYITATGAENKASKVKASLLLTVLGEKGLDIYNTFKLEEGHEYNFEEIIDKFQEYCKPRTNITFQRYLFNTYKRPRDFSFLRYVTALRKLSESCDFGDAKDSLIRDHIINNSHPDVTRKLLAVENLSLENCIKMCTAHEEVSKQSSLIRSNSNAPSTSSSAHVHSDQPFDTSNTVAPVHMNPDITIDQLEKLKLAVEAIKRQHGGRVPDGPTHSPSFSRRPTTIPAHNRKFKCSSCNSWHVPRRCPARNKRCYVCNGKNHFASACQSDWPQQNSRRRAVYDMQQDNIDTVSNRNIIINPVKFNPSSWIIDFDFHGSGQFENKFCKVNCKIDTGAMAYVLPLKLYEKLLKQIFLVKQPSKATLYSYTKHEIPVLGEVLFE